MLARKGRGKEAKLRYHGYGLTQSRNGLVVESQVTPAYGAAEWHAALLLAERIGGDHAVTLGAEIKDTM
jgi:hypothetical protein